jgi:hypothetical protein
MWYHVDRVWTDVSEAHIASTLRVEESASQEPAWEVASNQLARLHIPEDGILHSHGCVNLKSSFWYNHNTIFPTNFSLLRNIFSNCCTALVGPGRFQSPELFTIWLAKEFVAFVLNISVVKFHEFHLLNSLSFNAGLCLVTPKNMFLFTKTMFKCQIP